MAKQRFSEILSSLDSKYNTTLIDISSFFIKGGDKWLYNLIKTLHRDVFPNNERIVLYFDKDEHLYGDSPGKLITALQKYISDIDISNFFVIVVTSDTRTKADSLIVNDLYSTSDIPIEVITVDAVNSQFNPTPKKNEGTMCVHPWFQLHVGTGGDVLPCCDSVHSLPIGNIKNDSISDIISSDKFNAIREKMRNGERPLECATCFDLEDMGIESKRNIVNKQYPTNYNDIVEGAETMNISRIDINLGSTCNFKCRMCTGFSSSRLRAEEKKINTHGDITYPIMTQSDIDNVMPEILDMVETIDSFSFAGGESLLISEYNRILERLIQLNRTDVKITYTSNLSVLPKKTMKLWDKLSNIHVKASIDSVNEHAEYNRHGTKWNEVKANYIRLKNSSINMSINSTLTIYNAFRLIPFHQEWIEASLIHPNAMNINVVEHPDYLSVQVLPLYYRNLLNSHIEEHIEFLKGYNSASLIHKWKRIQKFLLVDNSHKLNNFFKYTDKLDGHRVEGFEFTHPEYIGLRQHIGE